MGRTLHVGPERATAIELHYQDQGTGDPVVLVHGWPLPGASWEKQASALLVAGHRVVSYDRRGFGASSRPGGGYDADTLAGDLHALVTHLDLHGATLVGHGMGAGEVLRYLAIHGAARVRRIALLAPVAPFLLRTADNPTGVDGAGFEAIQQALADDRAGFLARFLRDMFSVDVADNRKRISDAALRHALDLAVAASATATLACVATWLTDHRRDLAAVTIPTLIIHGDDDRVLPAAATSTQLARRIGGARLVVLRGAPHGLLWTHADDVNAELIAFLR
jgi:non-heme chloroperoxidase